MFLSASSLRLPPGAVMVSEGLDDRNHLIMSLADSAPIGGTLDHPSDLLVDQGGGVRLIGRGSDHGFPTGANVSGVEVIGAGRLFFTFDAPLTLGGVGFQPGDIAGWSAGAWKLHWHGSNFPVGAGMTDFYFIPGLAGVVPDGTSGSSPLLVENRTSGTVLWDRSLRLRSRRRGDRGTVFEPWASGLLDRGRAGRRSYRDDRESILPGLGPI